MIKFSFILIMVYVLYYAGNIIYDLYLKKGDVVNQEEVDIFSFSDLTDQKEEVTAVGIEDVENLNLPQSFIKKEITPSAGSQEEERQNLEELRRRFESEQDLDSPQKEDEPERKNDVQKPKDNSWQNILNLSETMVQLVSNIDGHKVYHSMM